MRSDWGTSTIGEVCMVTDGSHFSPPSVEVGHPMVSVKDFTSYGFDFDHCRYIGDIDYNNLKRSGCVPEKGDILIGKDGARFLEDAIIYNQEERPALLSSIAILRPDKDILLPEYLYYIVKNPGFKKYIQDNYGSGSAIPRIVLKDFKKVEIIFPKVEEQEKIISILSNLDRKIQLNTELNQNLIEQVVTLWRHLINEKQWPEITIADIAEKVAMGPFGSNIKVSTFVPEGIPVISGNHLRSYFLEEPEFNYITEEHAEKLKNSNVFSQDIIFTHAGNIGQVAMIPKNSKFNRYVISQRQFYLRCDKEKVVPEFVLFFFHSPEGQHELLSYANQTGVPSIAQPATNLKKIRMPLPPLVDQMRWYEMAKPLLDLYLDNRRECEILASTRDSLLPKLMSGKLDVSSLDI